MNDIVQRLRAAISDRYAVARELGQGAATVYLAHDIKHGRDVAIKVLHPDLGAALGGERFLSEIRTTARLQHPHILPLLDSGEADGLLYYVMPLVTGETLRARLERERQLPIADALRIAREVASALDYGPGGAEDAFVSVTPGPRRTQCQHCGAQLCQCHHVPVGFHWPTPGIDA